MSVGLSLLRNDTSRSLRITASNLGMVGQRSQRLSLGNAFSTGGSSTQVSFPCKQWLTDPVVIYGPHTLSLHVVRPIHCQIYKLLLARREGDLNGVASLRNDLNQSVKDGYQPNYWVLTRMASYLMWNAMGHDRYVNRQCNNSSIFGLYNELVKMLNLHENQTFVLEGESISFSKILAGYEIALDQFYSNPTQLNHNEVMKFFIMIVFILIMNLWGMDNYDCFKSPSDFVTNDVE